MAFLRAIRRHLRRTVLPRRWTTEHEPSSFQLGYAIPVSEGLHNEMRRMQLRILREYGWDIGIEESPHITLKQAFSVHDLEPFERYFDRLVSEVEPFEIRVTDIGFFDEGIIFLDVTPSSQLRALRSRILHDLSKTFGVTPNPLEDERYRFHATVAHGLPSAALDRARRTFGTKHVDFRFPCDSLMLLLHTGRQWLTYKSSSLVRIAPASGDTSYL